MRNPLQRRRPPRVLFDFKDMSKSHEPGMQLMAALADYLTEEGVDVACVHTYTQSVFEAEHRHFDVVMLENDHDNKAEIVLDKLLADGVVTPIIIVGRFLNQDRMEELKKEGLFGYSWSFLQDWPHVLLLIQQATKHNRRWRWFHQLKAALY